MNTLDKVIQNAFGNIAVSSEFPFFARRSSVVPMVLGAIGVAIAGGIVAVMIFSPRTRTRALDVAKTIPQKIGSSPLGKLGGALRKKDERVTQPNGLASEHAVGGYGTTSGV